MYGSRKPDRSERHVQWATCSSLARSAPVSVRSSRGPRPLLFPHFVKRQSRADRDYIEDGMPWVGRQAQLVNLFPRSNANVGRIVLGTLLSEIVASLFRARILFMRETLGESRDEGACAGQRHVSIDSSFSCVAGAQTGQDKRAER